MKTCLSAVALALFAVSFSANAAAPRTYEITFQGEAPVKVIVDEAEDTDADVTSQAKFLDKPVARVQIYVRYGQAYAHLTQRWVESNEYTHGQEHIVIPDEVTLETVNPLGLKATERAEFSYKNKAPLIVIARLE